MSDRLRLITRSDLQFGLRCAQLVHGMASFAAEHPDAFASWREEGSNTVVCLEVKGLPHLEGMLAEATKMELALSSFREPDLDDALTCVVLAPSSRAKKLCRILPLVGGRRG